ncbi:MAG: DUF4097 family beta strand repeat-containing protein [Candidatus Acidiferrales bacterium]
MPGTHRSRFCSFLLNGLICALPLFSPYGTIARENQPGTSSKGGPRVTSQLNGSVAAKPGQRLRLAIDLGNIVIHTRNSNQVDYQVRLEADSSLKDAKQLLKSFSMTAHEVPDGVSLRGQTFGRQCSGRLWVTVELNVPKNYNLEVSTGGGNIETEDVNGRIGLSTAGGNILAGNVGGPARLTTDGGHITVKNVAGDLVATTGGGHITTGSIAGNATLHTVGGHIRVASVEHLARLETGGGNVTLEHSGGELVASTGGGQIDVGEAAGLVGAKTAGGGIRVVRMSGPTNLETGGGSIYLTEVNGAVRATTGAGGITAWFVAAGKPGNCEFQSSDGDIVIYLPRKLPITIDAQIQDGDDHRVIFDPAFPVRLTYEDAANGTRRLRAAGELNGGGEVLHLRTVAGNIRLMLSDSDKQLVMYKQQMEDLEQRLQMQMRLLEQSMAADDRP